MRIGKAYSTGYLAPSHLGLANAHLIPISDLAQCELPSYGSGTIRENFTMDKKCTGTKGVEIIE